MSDERDAFYVGYHDEAPAGLARFLRARVIGLVVLVAALLAAIAAGQHGFVPSVFEFGNEREFVGWIQAEPVPSLIVSRPGDVDVCGAVSSYPLVALGKFADIFEP